VLGVLGVLAEGKGKRRQEGDDVSSERVALESRSDVVEPSWFA